MAPRHFFSGCQNQRSRRSGRAELAIGSHPAASLAITRSPEQSFGYTLQLPISRTCQRYEIVDDQ